jgi:hypothetical protein
MTDQEKAQALRDAISTVLVLRRLLRDAEYALIAQMDAAMQEAMEAIPEIPEEA